MNELEKNKQEGEQELRGKELYEIKKKQKEEAHKKDALKETLSEAPKKIGKYLLYGVIIAGIVGGIGWYIATRPPIIEEDIISRKGIHWHADLAITTKGVNQEIPANLGIGAAVHQSIHTHDSTGNLHIETQGLVMKDDTTLARFFKIWGKDFRSFGTTVMMTVNGKENTEFENYIMRDKDKIVLRYE